MKNTLALLIMLALTGIASAQTTNRNASVVLAWDPNPETNIVAYTIYHRTLGRSYVPAVTVTNGTLGTVGGLALDTTNFFVVTASNALGLESDFSNEVRCVIPGKPSAPANLRFSITINIGVEAKLNDSP